MVAAAEPQSDTPSPRRLVIRVVIPKGSLQAPVRRRLSRGVLLLILGTVAVLLSWAGVSLFRTDPTSTPAVTASTPNSESSSPAPVPARSAAAPAVSDEPPPKPTTETAETKSAEAEPGSTEANSVESEVRPQTDAPPSPINEVIPDVPQSALDTIRGTVRVTIRVIVDNEGAVLAAVADDPGPSRYFERLSLESSKKWTFAPADSEEQRIMVVRFNYRRDGVTARAIPPQ